jgi:hypothetical protein
MGSVAFSVTFLHSFASEKDFLKHCMANYYPELSESDRRATLKEVYRIVKKLKNERIGVAEQPFVTEHS